VIPTSALRRTMRSPGGRVLLRLFWVTLTLALLAAAVVWLWSLPEGAVAWPWQLSQAGGAGTGRAGMHGRIPET
jgi:hypothetical protein